MHCAGDKTALVLIVDTSNSLGEARWEGDNAGIREREATMDEASGRGVRACKWL